MRASQLRTAEPTHQPRRWPSPLGSAGSEAIPRARLTRHARRAVEQETTGILWMDRDSRSRSLTMRSRFWSSTGPVPQGDRTCDPIQRRSTRSIGHSSHRVSRTRPLAVLNSAPADGASSRPTRTMYGTLVRPCHSRSRLATTNTPASTAPECSRPPSSCSGCDR